MPLGLFWELIKPLINMHVIMYLIHHNIMTTKSLKWSSAI